MEINKLIENARIAVDSIKDFTQEQVDAITKAMSEIIIEHKEELAELAVKETGLGRVDHKIGKNLAMATNIYGHMKDKKSVGIINEIKELGLVEIAQPVGVIGSVTPTTNPIITPLGNGLMALKGKNALIVSPHPRSLKTTTKTVDYLRDAIASVGAPKDLLQIIDSPSIEKSQELMSKVDLIIATGGPAMVSAAYSSGKPAYGVGPGNVQLIMDNDFNVKAGVELTIIGRSFDNGIVCACTQSMIYPKEKEAQVFDEFRKQKSYVVENEEEVAKFRDLIFPEGVSNPKVVGQDPYKIAAMIDITIPNDTEIIVLKTTKYGKDDYLAKEKMCPVLVAIPYNDFDHAIEIADANLRVEGMGHSAGILTNNSDHAVKVGLSLPVCRVVVNQPTIEAGGGPNNGLNPTCSLGCGTKGNNIISENLTYKHLINISRVASPLK